VLEAITKSWEEEIVLSDRRSS